MDGVVEAGTHQPQIRLTGPVYTARCHDCGRFRRYESLREALFFANVHHRRLGQVPGQLAIVL